MNRLPRCKHNLALLNLVPLHAVLDCLNSLEEAGPEVANLGERKLLADAETGTAVEGDELPGLGLPMERLASRSQGAGQMAKNGGKMRPEGGGLPGFPALRPELVDVLTEEVLAALHGEGRVGDRRTGEDSNRFALAVDIAAGEGGILEGDADIERHYP